MVIICDKPFTESETYQKYFDLFDVQLSDFQKYAIYAIINGDHTLITAHTGSGKTLPAEFAITYFKNLNKKIIYTAPIKALCNQKLYDFRNKYPHISFGILTGDNQDNPEADVLIMTTEILRNTLFRRKMLNNGCDDHTQLSFDMNIEEELGCVIFDEVHYIGDADRGSVWEQAILLLPTQVQMLLLSATIYKPELFAGWIETEKNKQAVIQNKASKNVYLTSTTMRVVPLTHHMWLSSYKKHQKGVDNLLGQVTDKPILCMSPDGCFNETNYYKIHKALDFMDKNNIWVKRIHVLNSLVEYLSKNNMLPAICFVFSRKNVERYAQDIQRSLFLNDDNIPMICSRITECTNLIKSKFTNYKEFIDLPEFKQLMKLLEKGVAIHHAGMMPVLKEIVELLFDKKYIKLLFATETFAVGLNMPTKTVIFSGLSKYDGQHMRLLLSHEYKQMAGRAGRRNMDTIGHVIHCNNLFDLPTLKEYNNMLTGNPKKLISAFKVSYNLVLNLIAAHPNASFDKLKLFMDQSLIQNDIANELKIYENDILDLKKQLKIKKEQCNFCKTSKATITEYLEGKETSQTNKLGQSARKKLLRKLKNMTATHLDLEIDIKTYQSVQNLDKQIEHNKGYIETTKHYITRNIENIIDILAPHGFIEHIDETHWILTDKGIIGTHLQEAHSLALADLYEHTNGFENYSANQLVAIFSCFTNIRVPEDVAERAEATSLHDILQTITRSYEKYQDLEIRYNIDTNEDYDLHFNLVEYSLEWCKCTTDAECIEVINKIKSRKGIFLGEFIKALLKINNLASEFENFCETLNNMNLLQKMKAIPDLTLKYVVTNQSLYL